METADRESEEGRRQDEQQARLAEEDVHWAPFQGIFSDLLIPGNVQVGKAIALVMDVWPATLFQD